MLFRLIVVLVVALRGIAHAQEPSEQAEAERVRLTAAMGKCIEDKLWVCVEHHYVVLTDLERRENVALPYAVYFTAAVAAEQLGDVSATQDRLQRAQAILETELVADWLEKINANYGWVEIHIEPSYRGSIDLQRSESQLPADQRAVYDAARIRVRREGYFAGLLPVGQYDLVGSTVHLRISSVETGKSLSIDFPLPDRMSVALVEPPPGVETIPAEDENADEPRLRWPSRNSLAILRNSIVGLVWLGGSGASLGVAADVQLLKLTGVQPQLSLLVGCGHHCYALAGPQLRFAVQVDKRVSGVTILGVLAGVDTFDLQCRVEGGRAICSEHFTSPDFPATIPAPAIYPMMRQGVSFLLNQRLRVGTDVGGYLRHSFGWSGDNQMIVSTTEGEQQIPFTAKAPLPGARLIVRLAAAVAEKEEMKGGSSRRRPPDAPIDRRKTKERRPGV